MSLARSSRRSNDRHALVGVLLVVGVALFAVLFIAEWLAPESSILDLWREDGPIEYAGAFFWAACALICAARLLRGQEPRILLAFWLVVAFVAFGEELSWFQRIIGWETPAAISDINLADETNLHNLGVLWFGGLNVINLFRVAFLSYFLVLPIATMASGRVRALVARVGYRAPSVLFLVVIWSVIFISSGFQVFGPDASYKPLVETRESFMAFSILAYIYLYLRSDPVDEDHEIALRVPASSTAPL